MFNSDGITFYVSLTSIAVRGNEYWLWQNRHASRMNTVEMNSLRSKFGVKHSQYQS